MTGVTVFRVGVCYKGTFGGMELGIGCGPYFTREDTRTVTVTTPL